MKNPIVYPEKCLRRLFSYQYVSYWYYLKVVLESYIKHSNDQLPSSYLVLDAGCGSSGHVLALGAHGVGLDANRQNIIKALKHLRTIELRRPFFLVADVEKPPFQDEVFDIIICCDVLEHLKNKDNTIKALASCLKKGGKVFIATSNAFSMVFVVDQVLPKWFSDSLLRSLGEFYHERTHRTNPLTLKSKLSHARFEIGKVIDL